MNNINEKITKRITFTELHDLSIKNKDKYNQNVFTEKLLEDKPKIKDDVLKVKFLMEHNHHNGEEVPTISNKNLGNREQVSTHDLRPHIHYYKICLLNNGTILKVLR